MLFHHWTVEGRIVGDGDVRGLDDCLDAFGIDRLAFDHIIGDAVDLGALWRDRKGRLSERVKGGVLVNAHDCAGVTLILEGQ